MCCHADRVGLLRVHPGKGPWHMQVQPGSLAGGQTMGTDLPCERRGLRRSAPLLMLIPLFLVSFAAHAEEHDAEGPPFTAPAPPTSAPEAPAATAATES